MIVLYELLLVFILSYLVISLHELLSFVFLRLSSP
jgi:hypothetical protein